MYVYIYVSYNLSFCRKLATDGLPFLLLFVVILAAGNEDKC
jgi:hypothetical protein